MVKIKIKRNDAGTIPFSTWILYAGNPKEAERWAKKVLETAKKDNDADNIKIVNHLLDEIKNK
ncbi:Uncharacterised protein [uncultured Leptotrichia sp.]|jgi:hypothetical protein|uniref:hypothetical protein n=1 Tax=uncultured Leptotrichia sp. TaxID=159271 RepID=UPI001A38A316|nr:hypothetical protein [uncultured Leptotrichia sp.]VTX55513.1 Uncharacterised protein [uncultured Leptotrichia sp.]